MQHLGHAGVGHVHMFGTCQAIPKGDETPAGKQPLKNPHQHSWAWGRRCWKFALRCKLNPLECFEFVFDISWKILSEKRRPISSLGRFPTSFVEIWFALGSRYITRFGHPRLDTCMMYLWTKTGVYVLLHMHVCMGMHICAFQHVSAPLRVDWTPSAFDKKTLDFAQRMHLFLLSTGNHHYYNKW